MSYSSPSTSKIPENFSEPARTDTEAGATKETSKTDLYFLFCSAVVLIPLRDVYDVKNFTFSLSLLYLCSKKLLLFFRCLPSLAHFSSSPSFSL